jgi:formate dehydrogenase major subunit
MSFSIPEIEDAEVIFNMGYNGPVSHPLVARRIVRAKKKGCKIICVDPRRTETARIADLYLPIKGGTNMLFLNAMAHVIVTEGLIDHDFIKTHTSGFSSYAKAISSALYAPETVAERTRLDPQDIRKAAHLFASSKHTMTLWGMGITQFSQGVECVIACSNLCLLTGNYGHYATGVGPVRGQNNVQGTCDMGLLPDMLPGYQSVSDYAAREKFSSAWGVQLSARPGLRLTQVPQKVLQEKDPQKQIHAYYIIGEDPAQSDPNLPEIRETLSNIDFVIVQDIFRNKTCEYADVIFPATAWGEHEGVYTSCDRRFQRIHRLVKPSPDLKTDWDILCRLATAMGYAMHYDNTQQIWNEMRSLSPKFAGATYEKLEMDHGIQWPCYSPDISDTGTTYLHKNAHFSTADGKGHFYFYPYTPVQERENHEFPLSLATVREVGHYSVRTMTGNCRLLHSLAEEPGYIAMNPADCADLGIRQDELVRVISPRGQTMTRCLPTERVSIGSTYMTYQWWIGACNELTSSALDPKSNTPEFKYCACRVEKIDNQRKAEQYIQDQYARIRTNMGITPGGNPK